MRQAPAKVIAVVRPVVESLGYELVGVEYLAQGHEGLLRVYIDHADGIGLDDCQRVSHQLSGVLDVEDPIRSHYNLEVSSPGLDRPLFTLEHFQRYVGHEARLKLATLVLGRRKLSGTIIGVHDDEVEILVDGEPFVVSMGNIERANLVAQI